MFQRQRNQIRHCYEQQLLLSPFLTTRVLLQLVITSDGRVDTVETDPAAHPDLAACIKQAVTAWRFPAYRGNQVIVVRYPLQFRPVQD